MRGPQHQQVAPKLAADAVLLAAADAIANRTAELMGEAQVAGEVIPLKRAQ